jgi:dTDP-4-dehydrorhamnose 3,5-epimerase
LRQRRSSRPARAADDEPREEQRFAPREGWISGCAKDPQTVRADWLPAQRLIEGVVVRESRHLIKGEGLLTEIFRADWNLDEGAVGQVFEVRLGGEEVSAWHAHRFTRDRLFVTHGAARVVLYDARLGCPTYGVVNEFRLGSPRPTLVLVPPGVWHGVQNVRRGQSRVLNIVDKAYSYEDPDHWRLPPETPRIPYRFTSLRRRPG